MRGRWAKIGTLLLAVAGLDACIAPILTVPPPGAAGISFMSHVNTDSSTGIQTTLWTTQGGPLPSAALATYYVRDQALGAGVFAPALADGSFTARDMDGARGDQVVIYYVTPAGDYSESVCLVLNEGTPQKCP
jgi:hypothetical protein